MTKDEELIEREYRKTATIKASQWWKIGDHPAVAMASDVTEALRCGHDVPWIETLEGGHVVTPGDWIATGIKGEHWPIKPDVFAASYKPVENIGDDRTWPECLDPNAAHNRRSTAADRLKALAQPVVGLEGLREALEQIDMPWYDTDDAIDQIRAIARTALAAAPSPVVGDREAIARELILAVEDFINEPPRLYAIEPMEVRDYRHSLYRVWTPLRDAILSLSTPVVGGGWALVKALDEAAAQCTRVGAETTFAAEVSEDFRKGYKAGADFCRMAIGEMAKDAARKLPTPDPHTMDRAGMAQEVE